MNIQIKSTNIELTDALKEYAEEKINTLERYMDDILDARVELARTTMHHQSGDIFRCEVNLSVPERGVIRADSTEENLYAAIDTVIPKLKEQIETYKGKRSAQDRRLTRYMKSVFAWRPWRKRR